MTTSEAKKKLLLYRGPIDDDDPEFQEALAQARRDPELDEWVHDQVNCYNAIRSRLHEFQPPTDFDQTIVRAQPIPFPRDLRRILQLAAAILISVSVTAALMKWSDRRNSHVGGAQEILVTGEVLDMTCYIAYNLSGPGHAECAKVCIRNGAPVGLKAQNGKVYLLTAEPGQSVNADLADYAAKIVTIKGKQTVRDGFAQLQVEEIRKT